MAESERLTEEQIRNGWFQCGMNIDSFNCPVADKFGDVILFAKKVEEYTENRLAKAALVKVTEPTEKKPLLKSDGTPRAKAGPKPGWKQKKEEASKNVG